MSDQQQLDPYKEPPEQQRSVNWWLLGTGMLLFGVGDFFYFFAAVESTSNTMGGLILIGLTVAAAGLLFPVHRSLSLGVAAGYVVMTVVSFGECTWAFRDPLSDGGGAFVAVLAYPAALLIVGIVAIVISVKNRDRGPG